MDANLESLYDAAISVEVYADMGLCLQMRYVFMAIWAMLLSTHITPLRILCPCQTAPTETITDATVHSNRKTALVVGSVTMTRQRAAPAQCLCLERYCPIAMTYTCLIANRQAG